MPLARVSAVPVAAHLVTLAACGLGVRQVARLCGVAAGTVLAVRAGRILTLRPDAAARLLACPPLPAPGALVAATRARRALDSLRRDGYTCRELGWRLGARSQQLQIARRRIRAKTAARIARLYARLAET